ncbi:hypothetical protein QTP88_018468 [Uroleucon formosanum]
MVWNSAEHKIRINPYPDYRSGLIRIKIPIRIETKVDNNEKIADYLNNNEAGLVRNPNQWIESEIRIYGLNP